MIASLPMYDRPEVAAATDRLWQGIRDALRDRGIDAPAHLTRGGDPYKVWEAPDLVLSQTCGLPYRARLKDRVEVIGAPDLGLADCPPGFYYSVIVTRSGADLPEAPRLAVNDPLSQSGWANLLTWLDRTGTRPGAVTMTGAHRASARAVADGTADLAALDVQSWTLMRDHDAWTAGLQVIDRTDPIAGLPYIAPKGADVAPYMAALDRAIGGLDAADRAALNLHGIVAVAPRDYTRHPIPPAPPMPG